MRFCVLISAVCLLVSFAPAQPARDTLWLTMDDSVKIDCTMFTPTDSPPPGGFPAIVFVHGLSGNKTWCEASADTYARHGYVTLAYSLRGQGRSTGLCQLFSWRERQDQASILSWLAARPNVNDTLLGVNGVSQGGYLSWYSGIDEIPGVRAVAPENAVPHIEDNMARDGCYAKSITAVMNYSANVRIDTVQWPFKRLMREDQYDSVRLLMAEGRTFDSSDVASSTAAYLAMGAWHDHSFEHNLMPGAFAVAPPKSLLYMGTGGHGSEYSAQEVAFRDSLSRWFFAERLKGEDHGLDTVGPAVIVTGPNWQHYEFPSWPPPGAAYSDFWLHSDGTLSDDPPSGADSFARLEHRLTNTGYTWLNAVNNNFAQVATSFLNNRVIFRTAPLGSAVTVMGIPLADVWARGPLPRFQVSLQLYDEPPTGPPRYLTHLTLGLRDNPDTLSWHNFTGQFVIVGWEVAAGHRLRVDWAGLGRTLTDSTVWLYPYWNADGWLTLGLDSLHPARISLPILQPTGVAEHHEPPAADLRQEATLVRGVLYLPRGPGSSSSPGWLLDAAGRRIS